MEYMVVHSSDTGLDLDSNPHELRLKQWVLQMKAPVGSSKSTFLLPQLSATSD